MWYNKKKKKKKKKRDFPFSHEMEESMDFLFSPLQRTYKLIYLF